MTEAIQVKSVKDMASEVTDGLHKATEAVMGDGAKAGAQSSLRGSTTESKKIKDLTRDMIDVHTKQPMTTDFGHKVSNTDNWLKVASDKSTGPHLLEDQQAREKVNATAAPSSSWANLVSRFIASTMSVFPSELFTLEDLLLSANSHSSKAQRMLLLHLC